MTIHKYQSGNSQMTNGSPYRFLGREFVLNFVVLLLKVALLVFQCHPRERGQTAMSQTTQPEKDTQKLQHLSISKKFSLGIITYFMLITLQLIKRGEQVTFWIDHKKNTYQNRCLLVCNLVYAFTCV